MKLNTYDVHIHRREPWDNWHVDVTLEFEGKAPIKMCECSAYLGQEGKFGDAADLAAVVREDLDKMANAGVDYEVRQDTLDGSIDIFRATDEALMFSMECDRIEGNDWVEKYSSVE